MVYAATCRLIASYLSSRTRIVATNQVEYCLDPQVVSPYARATRCPWQRVVVLTKGVSGTDVAYAATRIALYYCMVMVSALQQVSAYALAIVSWRQPTQYSVLKQRMVLPVNGINRGKLYAIPYTFATHCPGTDMGSAAISYALATQYPVLTWAMPLFATHVLRDVRY
eukprot:3321243-Rhodomonas_salina.1